MSLMPDIYFSNAAAKSITDSQAMATTSWTSPLCVLEYLFDCSLNSSASSLRALVVKNTPLLFVCSSMYFFVRPFAS